LGATPQRMLREIVQALEALTATRPLVLVLEDLHWSDTATLDVLSLLARRQEMAGLLLIGTYRSEEVRSTGHPLSALIQDLQMRGYCQELTLPLLSVTAVRAYLTARFPGPPCLRGWHSASTHAAMAIRSLWLIWWNMWLPRVYSVRRPSMRRCCV